MLIFQYFPGPLTKFQYIQGLEFLLSNSSIFQVFQDVYEPCINNTKPAINRMIYVTQKDPHSNYKVSGPNCTNDTWAKRKVDLVLE